MKKILTLLTFILVSATIWAQVPQKMSYQAVIRNSSNALIANTPVGIKISVLQGSATGTSVYSETHTTTTNANGLVSLQIGAGLIVSGSFATINWNNGPYFIKTETDLAGGTNYSISGTTELLSVPYALSAGQSSLAPGNAVGDMQYWNGSAWVLLPIGNAYQILKVNNNIPQWSNTSQATPSTVSTDAINAVKAQEATVTGTVITDGGEFVITRGFCYSTSPNPTVTNGAITSGNGLGIFSTTIAGLSVSTTYYVRAFSTTIAGTSYGSTLSFTTTSGIVVLTTTPATNIVACGADSGGIITSDGGSTVNSSGVCYGTSPNPTITSEAVSSDLSNSFIVTLTTSQPNTVYYYRSYAQNATGVYYGNQLSFTTQNYTATVTTNAATLIKSCSATISISFTPSLPNSVDYSAICYSTSPLPTTDDVFTGAANTTPVTLSCLLPNTTYYARALIGNCNGTKYGNQITFTTLNNTISVTTNAPTEVRSCTLFFPPNTINYGGADTSCYTSTGMYYASTPNPSQTNGLIPNNDNSGNYYMYNLTPNTTYYARSYITLCNGSKIYGNQIQVTTLPKYTSIITNATTDITAGTATLNASIIGNGQDYIYYGICFGTAPNPTIANTSFYYSSTSGSTNLAKPIQGLTANTTYYARVFVHSDCIGINYGNEVSFTTISGPLVLGQFYQGGIIIQLTTATSGLIAAPTDQGTATWGCEGTSIAGTQSTVGSGQANTNAIIAGCTTAGTAAKICDALVLNGKSDWYLPSEQELLLIGQLTYFSRSNYDNLTLNSLSYWSSTQSTAIQAKIGSANTSGTTNKSDNTINIKTIRSF